MNNYDLFCCILSQLLFGNIGNIIILYMKYLLPGLSILFLLIAGIFFSTKVISSTSHIVISEIQIGKSGATADEFIELYNPTSLDVNLSGWKLTRKTSGNNEGNLINSLSKTIPAFGFFLITSDESSSSPSADLIYSTNNIANNNSVLLYDETQKIVDKVGIGSLSTDPESSGTANLANNGKSLERKPGESDPLSGNGEDTDNNFNDFVIRDVPEPQNSQSDKEPQITPTNTPTPTEEVTPTTTPVPSPTPTETIPTPTNKPILTNTPTPTPFDHREFKWPFLKCEFSHRIIRVGFLKLRIPSLVCRIIN